MRNWSDEKNTMENSASNLSNIQALQAHAQQVLPLITQALSAKHYREIVHQRISSQQSKGSETDYQGLTRAQHSEFGRVMIKWQLNEGSDQNFADLNHEAKVLTSLASLTKNNLTAIAPPILAYDNSTIPALNHSQQLTIIVMPYYLNASLARRINANNHSLLTVQQKHHFIVQSAHLITNLHNVGWLHNDIKPSNILLDGLLPNSADNSRVMPDLLLTDFALAQRFHAAKKLHHLAGTSAYLAPERWQGQGATVQSDIYAFGIMMVEILMGMRPFNIDNQSNDPLKDWAMQHCQQPMPALPLQYNRYQSIIDRALAKRVEKRYQSMDEVLEGLERL